MTPLLFLNRIARSSFLLGAFLSYGWGQAAVPTFSEVQERLVQSDFRLLDRKGEVLHELRTNLKIRQRGWIPISEISTVLREAVVRAEDKNFFRHHGVDWLALAGAAGQRLLGKTSRGASTISMQLAALLDKKLRAKGKRRTWWLKQEQIAEALRLERTWSKERILEAYLNLVSFRGELQGIASAATGLFGKSPSGLNQEESMILAALIRSPESDEKKVVARACALAPLLNPPGSCEKVRALVGGRGLSPHAFPSAVALAPHVARLLLNSQKDHSTLDRKIQMRVSEILRRQVLSLRERNMNDAAALVVDNKSGEVLAYVGSVGDLSAAGAVDGVRANRQAGSTLKPFLYSLAVEKKYLTASSLLDDSATDISLGAGAVYRPRDFDHEYHGGDVTLRLALASSLNIPAVRTLQLIGVGNLVERMKALGFMGMNSAEFYGPSLALGTADVTLWELVNAYRTLANGGLWSPLVLAANEIAPSRSRRVVSPEGAFIISDVLSDKESRSLTFGLDSPMSLAYWTASKTGTSKDMRDNWCIGFSGRYTVGVWTGNFSGKPMWNVTGISGAAPAWANIMDSLHGAGKDLAPRPPAGVIRMRDEWYIRGTEPAVQFAGSRSQTHARGKIVYPVDGMVIARDPDIPPNHQRLFFQSSPNGVPWRWSLNGKELVSAAAAGLSWQPEAPGGYDLKLLSGDGTTVDQIHFIVR